MRLLLNGLSASAAVAGISQDWTNTALSPEDRAAALLAEMTLQEKYDMLHGWPNELDGDVIYVGFVIGNERLGIPELRLNDGPQGYRDNLYPFTSTAWPSAMTVATSWDRDYITKWAEAMGDEFYRKGANVFLGPGLNLARVPLNGRNFEYMSGEDPYLGNQLVRPFVEGMQSKGVITQCEALG